MSLNGAKNNGAEPNHNSNSNKCANFTKLKYTQLKTIQYKQVKKTNFLSTKLYTLYTRESGVGNALMP